MLQPAQTKSSLVKLQILTSSIRTYVSGTMFVIGPAILGGDTKSFTPPTQTTTDLAATIAPKTGRYFGHTQRIISLYPDFYMLTMFQLIRDRLVSVSNSRLRYGVFGGRGLGYRRWRFQS